MNTSRNLANVAELEQLGKIAGTINEAAQDLAKRWLVVGATARELLLRHMYGVKPGRRTVDLDVGVAVHSWTAFQRLRDRLIAAGGVPAPNIPHRLLLQGWQVDLVPFGAVERDGAIVWPSGDAEMCVLGFAEASEHAIDVILPKDITVSIASIPGLLILKLIAWDDRHVELPHHDAYDLRILIDSYSEGWNSDRIYEEADDLLQEFNYDNPLAAAALLGRDARAIAQSATIDCIRAILDREAGDDSWLLVSDMNGRADENLRLIQALRAGFENA